MYVLLIYKHVYNRPTYLCTVVQTFNNVWLKDKSPVHKREKTYKPFVFPRAPFFGRTHAQGWAQAGGAGRHPHEFQKRRSSLEKGFLARRLRRGKG